MNITLSSSALSAVLAKLGGVVEKKTTMPILANVMLQADADQITVTGTDLEKECAITVPATVAEPGDICLDLAKLTQITNTPIFKGKDITIKTNAERTTISTGKSKFQVNQLPAVDYPVMDTLKEPGISLSIPAQNLRYMLATVEHAMGVRDTRYYLNGALLELDADQITAVTTDGHRSAMFAEAAATGLGDGAIELILPNTSVRALLDLLKGAEQELAISAKEHHRIEIAMADLVFRSKVIDGKFPDWRRAIPRNDHICNVSKSALLQVIKAAEIIARRDELGAGIGVEFRPENGGSVAIWARANGEHTELEPIACEYSGPTVELGVTSGYLVDAITQSPGDRVQIELQEANASILVRGAESDNPKFVVSPRRL